MADHLISGVTIPLVTAMDRAGRPDAAGAFRLLDELASAGVRRLMLLGSNGEGALLEARDTTGFVRETGRYWRSLHAEGTVIVNVSAPGTDELLHRAEAVLDGGADALVVTPPRYFSFRADEIVRHIRAVERFGMPYVVYSIPKYANPLTAEILAALLESPLLIGVKDSSGDLSTLSTFVELAESRPDVAISQGSERDLIRGLRAGARGIVPGIANIAPALAVQVFETWRRDPIAAQVAQDAIDRLLAIHAVRAGVPAVKAILHDHGLLDTPQAAAPFSAVTDAELAGLRRVLDDANPGSSQKEGHDGSSR